MENLVDMKRPKEKKGEKTQAIPETLSGPDYAWGLRVTLDKPEIDKLKLSLKDMKVGTTVTLVAECEVVAIRESVGKRDYENSASVELQITKMNMGEGSTKKESLHDRYNMQNKKGAGE